MYNMACAHLPKIFYDICTVIVIGGVWTKYGHVPKVVPK